MQTPCKASSPPQVRNAMCSQFGIQHFENGLYKMQSLVFFLPCATLLQTRSSLASIIAWLLEHLLKTSPENSPAATGRLGQIIKFGHPMLLRIAPLQCCDYVCGRSSFNLQSWLPLSTLKGRTFRQTVFHNCTMLWVALS